MSQLDSLTYARKVANLVRAMPGIDNYEGEPTRPRYCHIAAALADTSLQAGVRYDTVVAPRVKHILCHYPELTTVRDSLRALGDTQPGVLLNWRHPRKPQTFLDLLKTLESHGVNTCDDLREWAQISTSRATLLGIHGIGPKSADYLACLVGVDIVPVDRHILSFVKAAGVPWADYSRVRTVFSFAADLLGVRRAILDAAVWRWAARGKRAAQLRLL